MRSHAHSFFRYTSRLCLPRDSSLCRPCFSPPPSYFAAIAPMFRITCSEKRIGFASLATTHAPRTLFPKAHHGDNNNWGEYDTVEEVISAAQNRAKFASRTMPDCLGGGVGASSPVWMRDYSQPNDKEPKNPRARAMIGARFFTSSSYTTRA